jgi:hypothetical protein
MAKTPKPVEAVEPAEPEPPDEGWPRRQDILDRPPPYAEAGAAAGGDEPDPAAVIQECPTRGR